MLFQGHQQDPESSLYYLRARYYDPHFQRFISRDPVAGFLENPLSQHPYQYAYNNPINFSDPSGQLPRTGNPYFDVPASAIDFLLMTPAGQRVVQFCTNVATKATGLISKSPATQAIVSDPNKINHILQEKHAWSKVVSDPNDWNQVSQVINKVISSGTSSPGDKPNKVIKSLQVGKEWVEVSLFTNKEGVTSIENAWVRK